MTDAELDALSVVIANVVKVAIAPILGRIAALEQRGVVDGRDGKDGEPGRDGKDAVIDMPAVVAEVLKALPTPKDGRDGADGRDGKDASVDVGAIVAAVLDELPAPLVPRDGVDGRDGKDGKDAEPVDVEAIVKAAAALIPTPRDGRDGQPGPPGRDGKDGDKGADGLNGKDGADGLGFDDFEEEYDGERTIVHRYRRGDRVKEFRHVIANVIDRGVYQPGRTYEKGDGVTWAGSFWIAQAATSAKPGDASEASRAWRLAVKKGSDGKQGPEGKPGPQGPMGPQGPQGPKVY